MSSKYGAQFYPAGSLAISAVHGDIPDIEPSETEP
jgi:hypothetical protein